MPRILPLRPLLRDRAQPKGTRTGIKTEKFSVIVVPGVASAAAVVIFLAWIKVRCLAFPRVRNIKVGLPLAFILVVHRRRRRESPSSLLICPAAAIDKEAAANAVVERASSATAPIQKVKLAVTTKTKQQQTPLLLRPVPMRWLRCLFLRHYSQHRLSYDEGLKKGERLR